MQVHRVTHTARRVYPQTHTHTFHAQSQFAHSVCSLPPPSSFHRSLTTLYNNNNQEWDVCEGVCVFWPAFSQCNKALIIMESTQACLTALLLAPFPSITSQVTRVCWLHFDTHTHTHAYLLMQAWMQTRHKKMRIFQTGKLGLESNRCPTTSNVTTKTQPLLWPSSVIQCRLAGYMGNYAN